MSTSRSRMHTLLIKKIGYMVKILYIYAMHQV